MPTTAVTQVTQEHIDAMNKAKVHLMSRPDSAFFTTVLFSLRLVWDYKIPTAATDGRRVLINPQFFMSLTLAERVFILIHEAMHVAYIHMIRMKMFADQKKANMAADYVINLQLVDRHFQMPSMGLLDRAYAGMSTEQVYALLPDHMSDNFEMDLMEGDGDAAAEEALTQEIQEILVRAQIQSKMAGDKPGTIPSDIEVFLNDLLNPKLPWHRILQKYLNSFDKNDYSFKKFNRRFFPQWYLPGLHSFKLQDLTIAVDISGSVSDHDFQVFVSEVASIFRMMKPEKITLIQFDTELQHIDTIKNIKELLALQFHGRGGTCVFPVMEWAKKNRPQLLLMFSDGGFHIPDGPAPTETLWIIHNNPSFVPKFGKVIHYSIESR